MDANFFTFKNPIPAIAPARLAPVSLERRQIFATAAARAFAAPAS